MYVVYVLGFKNLKPIGYVEAARFSNKSLAVSFLNKHRESKPDHADSYWGYV
jgi:hypothetical protein